MYTRKQNYLMWRDLYRMVRQLPVPRNPTASYELREAAYCLMTMNAIAKTIEVLDDPDLLYRIFRIFYDEERRGTLFWKRVKEAGFDVSVSNAISAGMGPLMWAANILTKIF